MIEEGSRSIVTAVHVGVSTTGCLELGRQQVRVPMLGSGGLATRRRPRSDHRHSAVPRRPERRPEVEQWIRGALQRLLDDRDRHQHQTLESGAGLLPVLGSEATRSRPGPDQTFFAAGGMAKVCLAGETPHLRSWPPLKHTMATAAGLLHAACRLLCHHRRAAGGVRVPCAALVPDGPPPGPRRMYAAPTASSDPASGPSR